MLCAHTLFHLVTAFPESPDDLTLAFLRRCPSLTRRLSRMWLRHPSCSGAVAVCLLLWCLQHHIHNSSASRLGRGLLFMPRDISCPSWTPPWQLWGIPSYALMDQANSGLFPAVLQSSPAAFTHVRVQVQCFRCTQVEELLHLVTKLIEEVEYLRQRVKLQTEPSPREACCLSGTWVKDMKRSSLAFHSPQIITNSWFFR